MHIFAYLTAVRVTV